MENNIRETATPDTIITIIPNLIDRGYHGACLAVQLRPSIDAREFLSTPIIRQNQFYQWFRHVLDIAEINTRFEENTQHKFVAVRIIRALWPEGVAVLTNAFEASLTLTIITSRAFHLPTPMNYMHTWAFGDIRDTNNIGNTSLGIYIYIFLYL